MSLDSLILDLATRLDLPELALNANRVCQVVVDGDLAVSIEDAPLSEAAHFYAVISRVPDVEREEFYARLLEAQLFGQETGGGTAFGLDPSTDEILFCRKLPIADLSNDHFAAAFGEFLDWAGHWKAKLAGLESLEANPSGTSSENLIRA